ncbi:MAG: hypothetical protein R3304_12385 [Longimicrobiales bacterium]|nr:hypothetical protein [Longimicrobiales bacterium]
MQGETWGRMKAEKDGDGTRRSARAKGTIRLAVATWVSSALFGCASPAQAQTRADWCPEPEVAQFDFWLGSWDVQNLNSPPGSDAWYATGKATNRVYTVLGGCAVVEQWEGYAFPTAGHVAGFGVRAYDPEAEQWELVLLWPVGGPPRFGNPEGRFEDGRGVFYAEFTTSAGGPRLSRLTFDDIQDDTFRWQNGVSADGGATWTSSWIMEQSRRPATAPELWNGPSMTTDRCPQAAHRAFDGWLGGWTGTRRTETGDTLEVRARLVRILGGCAVMERTRTGDGTWGAFRVRAFESATRRWLEYAMASDRRRLHRREVVLGTEEIAVTDTEPVDGVYRRTRWRTGERGLSRVEERASAPDGPWRVSWEDRLEPLAAPAPSGG